MNAKRHVAAAALALALAGCDTGPKAITYGQDACAECKMTLVDRHFGAELITPKGKVFKFDDIHCLLVFQRRPGTVPAAQVVVIDFNRPNTFLPVAQAVFLNHDNLHTPMGSGIAAFSTEAELKTTHAALSGGGRILRWPEVSQSH